MFGHIILCLLFGEETLEDGSTKTLDLVVVVVVSSSSRSNHKDFPIDQ